MQYQVSLRTVNQNFAHYIKMVEAGNEIVITRHGHIVARITGVPSKKILSTSQIESRARLMKMMKKGFSLKGERFKREDLHER